jgi:hypothetical protein
MALVIALRILAAVAASAFVIGAGRARAAAPLYDPVMLNIGISCQWQQRCQHQQRDAMHDAAKFIAAKHPPLWKIHLCNRNAGRGTARVDWIGFNHCIRNYDVGGAPRPR